MSTTPRLGQGEPTGINPSIVQLGLNAFYDIHNNTHSHTGVKAPDNIRGVADQINAALPHHTGQLARRRIPWVWRRRWKSKRHPQNAVHPLASEHVEAWAAMMAGHGNGGTCNNGEGKKKERQASSLIIRNWCGGCRGAVVDDEVNVTEPEPSGTHRRDRRLALATRTPRLIAARLPGLPWHPPRQ